MLKKVLIAILARDKEATLPLYLDCIRNLDYDKKLITLYIRTNNNSDNTERLLTDFIEKHRDEYAYIEFDNTNIDKELTKHHDWNYDRFKVLGKIRNESLVKTIHYGCDYYFVADCDNFILPHTLKSLIKHDVPIVAPFLISDRRDMYSNFHHEVDANGYLKHGNAYNSIFLRDITGLIEVGVAHCTYLVKSSAIPYLNYDDNSGRYEYVIFSHCARMYGNKQYLDNSEVYGLITFKTEKVETKNYIFDNLSYLIDECDVYNVKKK